MGRSYTPSNVGYADPNQSYALAEAGDFLEGQGGLESSLTGGRGSSLRERLGQFPGHLVDLARKAISAGVSPTLKGIKSFVNKGAKKGKEAFTLIELLVVVAIIGTLAAILTPAVQSGLEKARRTNIEAYLNGVSKNVAAYQMDKLKFLETRFAGSGYRVDIPAFLTHVSMEQNQWKDPYAKQPISADPVFGASFWDFQNADFPTNGYGYVFINFENKDPNGRYHLTGATTVPVADFNAVHPGFNLPAGTKYAIGSRGKNGIFDMTQGSDDIWVYCPDGSLTTVPLRGTSE